MVHDDSAILAALHIVWQQAEKTLPKRTTMFRVGVTLIDIASPDARQMDILLNDDGERKRCEAITPATEGLNSRYSKNHSERRSMEPA
ncbi:MAG: hypothetical protein M3O03_07650 [Pseudomonadota bacterium]|nr:hypothetical protein [Pseudomonadota bacterium]